MNGHFQQEVGWLGLATYGIVSEELSKEAQGGAGRMRMGGESPFWVLRGLASVIQSRTRGGNVRKEERAPSICTQMVPPARNLGNWWVCTQPHQEGAQQEGGAPGEAAPLR